MAATDEIEAIALEEDDPTQHVGDEAESPSDTGRPPEDEGIDPTEAEQPEEEMVEPPSDDEELPSTWRAAVSLLALRKEVDANWPNRDRRTDGMIGDLAHCPPGGGTSDHCPNAARVVRAYDIDSDGIPAAWLAEHFRQLGASGDKRLAHDGYVIFNRRIASATHGWKWREYTGSSPHTDHIHLSVTKAAAGYDGTGLWGIKKARLPQHPLGSRVLREESPAMRGTDVAWVQRRLGATPDGEFGPKTKASVKAFQNKKGLEANGIVDPTTWGAMRVT